MDTTSILKMIGALGSAVGGVAGSFGGAASPSTLPPATAPTLDQLTLNPQVMGQNPPQVPYDFGQGHDLLPPETQPPGLPPGQTADQAAAGEKEGGGFGEGVKAFGDALSKLGSFKSSVDKSPLAQRMFQEQQQKTVVQNQMQEAKMQQFKNADMSSRILESMGLL